jgi:tRNA nucleotidyltransferase (CCA-adding enzyme)
LTTWWERPNEILDQPVLLDGTLLMEALQLEPGPRIGELLEAIRIGQVEGRVKTREEGLALARSFLEQKQNALSPKA